MRCTLAYLRSFCDGIGARIDVWHGDTFRFVEVYAPTSCIWSANRGHSVAIFWDERNRKDRYHAIYYLIEMTHCGHEICCRDDCSTCEKVR